MKDVMKLIKQKEQEKKTQAGARKRTKRYEPVVRIRIFFSIESPSQKILDPAPDLTFT